jgi:hypothetical protein
MAADDVIEMIKQGAFALDSHPTVICRPSKEQFLLAQEGTSQPLARAPFACDDHSITPP